MPQGNYLQNLSLLQNASIPIFSTKKSKWLKVMLHRTIRNDDFTAQSVAMLEQSCNY